MDMMEDLPISVVLPASGSGERFGSSVPKQYCHVLQRPLILFTLKTFHGYPWVKHIVVTVSEEYKNLLEELVARYNLSKVIIALGASARHRSIYNGLKALKTLIAPDEVVIIHDAVRLFAEEQVIRDVAIAARNYGASGVIRPLVSTVVATSSDGLLETSLDRNRYRASEMPQGFIYSVILSAYEKATDMDFDYGTECLHLAMKYCGTRAELIDGPSSLWKVTHQKDIHAAEGTLKETAVRVMLKHEDNCKDLAECIQAKLKRRKLQVVNETASDCANCAVYLYQGLNCDNIQSNMERQIYKGLNCDNIQSNAEGQIYKGLNCNDIPSNTEGQLSSRHTSLQFLDTVVVHVIRSVGGWMEDYKKLIDMLQPVTQKWKDENVLVYYLLYTVTSSTDKVGEMTASILWNRDPVMAGQIFSVNH